MLNVRQQEEPFVPGEDLNRKSDVTLKLRLVQANREGLMPRQRSQLQSQLHEPCARGYVYPHGFDALKGALQRLIDQRAFTDTSETERPHRMEFRVIDRCLDATYFVMPIHKARPGRPNRLPEQR